MAARRRAAAGGSGNAERKRWRGRWWATSEAWLCGGTEGTEGEAERETPEATRRHGCPHLAGLIISRDGLIGAPPQHSLNVQLWCGGRRGGAAGGGEEGGGGGGGGVCKEKASGPVRRQAVQRHTSYSCCGCAGGDCPAARACCVSKGNRARLKIELNEPCAMRSCRPGPVRVIVSARRAQ